jgi:subtilisin-like proprotein convertase family protein
MRKIYLLLGATFLLSLFGGNSLLAQCNIQVSVSSVGWGDVTSWELQDGSGTAVLTGGTYGNGYSDVQSTVGTNPPYTLIFTINNASFCDNSPNYVVTLDGVPDISGNLSVGCANVVVPLAVSPCPPATPPTPTQDPGIPTCIAGTNLSVVGTPDTDVLWYWQTSASGTSMSDLYTGPYNVFANGTYYLRAYHTVNLDWSTNSSSVVVSNFPTATAPPAPTADLNPSCVTTGSILTASPAPVGFEYYWQGTTVNGTSNLLPANVTYNAAASGTYHLAAFETATGCWSTTSFINVTVDTYIPDAPSAAISDYFICAGITSQEITATVPANGSVSATTGPISLSVPDSNPAGVSSPIVISGIPAGATITGIDVNFNLNHTWNSDMDFSLIGPNLAVVDLCSDNGGSGDNFINTTISSAGVTPITGAVAPMTGVYAPEGSMVPLYTVPNGTWSLFMADDAGGDLGTLLNWTITISYSLPVSTLDWYDAAAAGTFINSGTPLETIGTSVISSPAPGGVFSFFAESVSGGCTSATRTEITVSSSPVNVQLIPVAVTCNNGNDGTFTLGVVTCGSSPFTYSTDGGVTFGAIPTDLTVGDHSIIVKDALDLLSGTYTVTIGDAPAPSALVINDFTNDIVDFSWTGNGTETAWHVEWGLAGFTPGTGAEVGSANVSSPTHIATGLDGYTQYDFYVAADCGAGTSAGTWVSISQLTLCDPLLAQGFCETFDSSSPTEACWTVKNENGDLDFWNMNYNVNTYSGDQVAMMLTDGNAGVNNDWLISPMMTLTNNEILSFFYRVQSSFEPNDFELVLSTTGMDPADFTNVLMASSSYSNTVYADTIN